MDGTQFLIGSHTECENFHNRDEMGLTMTDKRITKLKRSIARIKSLKDPRCRTTAPADLGTLPGTPVDAALIECFDHMLWGAIRSYHIGMCARGYTQTRRLIASYCTHHHMGHIL